MEYCILVQKNIMKTSWIVFFTPIFFLIIGVVLKVLSPEAFQIFFVGSINRGNVMLFIVAAVYANERSMKADLKINNALRS